MKRRNIIIIVFLFSVLNLQSQDYSVIPTKLNAQGLPGTFFLSRATIQNNSGNTIQLFLTRIVKDLPPNWTSCFCYPECLAPFIDTLRFNISAYSTDSIMPNYGTDTIPGFGTVQITLYQVGYESQMDTITFTGSTLSTGVKHEPVSDLMIFPNPFSGNVTFINNFNDNFKLKIINPSGQEVFTKTYSPSSNYTIDLSFLSPGFYYFIVESRNRKFFSPCIKSN